MISTVLATMYPFVRVLFVAFVVLCVVAGWLLTRAGARGRRGLRILGLLGLLAVLGLTLTPSSAEPAAAFCTLRPFPLAGGVTGLANVVLFVPVAYFGGLATRRPFVGLACAVGLSVAIELIQGAVVPLGRACDTDDLWDNTVGAAAGALLAALTMAVARRVRPRGPRTVDTTTGESL